MLSMEARALCTLIYLPGKAFTIIIAIGKNTGFWLRHDAHSNRQVNKGVDLSIHFNYCND